MRRAGLVRISLGAVVDAPVRRRPWRSRRAASPARRDATGGALPGVTVEASSEVLIERTRSVVTDGEGQYRFVDLRPGLYELTFSLAGFAHAQARGHPAAGRFRGQHQRRHAGRIAGRDADGHR